MPTSRFDLPQSPKSSTLRRPRRWALAALVGAVTTSFAAPGLAQDAADGEFSVQRFNPAPGPGNYFTTRGARIDGHLGWSAGFMANYAYQPFVVRSCQSETNCDDPNAVQGEDTKVVESLFAFDAMGSLSLVDRLQLGLRVPLAFSKGQGVGDTGGSDPDGISGFGMGDLELEVKARAYGEVKDPFVLGAALFATGPLGNATAEGTYIGDSGPTVGLRGIFDGEEGALSFGGNLAGVYRSSSRVGSTELGTEFRYNLAAGYRVSPVLRVVVDAFGSTKFSADNGTNALEGDAGIQVTPLGSPILINAGIGTGLIQGIGVPGFRGFLGVTYSATKKDRDGDGIMDDQDQCPTEPEDKDGQEDSDGCPEGDNDGDTIPDDMDKCPDKAEDPDGFEDLDGCPEDDNDKDGIKDNSDRCPLKPETKNGFKDEDGCPDEPDKDNDGVPDGRDKCPSAPEDTDGFQDTDGCPDPDNDGDGVPDNQDECADEKETINGFKDEDGCPDEGPKLGAGKAKVMGAAILYGGAIKFNPGTAKFAAGSTRALNAVASLIKREKIKGVAIAAGAGKPDLAQRRADAVKRYLNGRGVPKSRLTTQATKSEAVVFKITKKK